MKKQLIIALGLPLAACGGGIDGNYAGGPNNMISIAIDGDKAVAARGAESKAGTVSKAEKSVFITIDKETKEFKVDEKGCLVNTEMGAFCKK